MGSAMEFEESLVHIQRALSSRDYHGELRKSSYGFPHIMTSPLGESPTFENPQNVYMGGVPMGRVPQLPSGDTGNILTRKFESLPEGGMESRPVDIFEYYPKPDPSPIAGGHEQPERGSGESGDLISGSISLDYTQDRPSNEGALSCNSQGGKEDISALLQVVMSLNIVYYIYIYIYKIYIHSQ